MRTSPVLVGLDIGTSSTRAVAADEGGRVLGVAAREYGIDTPRPGWAEQRPEAWWAATVEVLREVLAALPSRPESVAGVSFSGQMHGAVLLDSKGQTVRPAIIWPDQRSSPQVARMREAIGLPRMLELTCNVVNTGFMAATLAWLREAEPRSVENCRYVMLPKDYVRFRLTGEVRADVSDASSTLLFDVAHRRWSDEMARLLGIPEAILPPLCESHEPAGTITRCASEQTGLPEGVPVVAGGGDKPVAAIGNGAISADTLLVTVGTGGQLFVTLEQPCYDAQARVHTFCHALPDRWHLLGAILSAGLSLRWFRDSVARRLSQVNYHDLESAALEVTPGAGGCSSCPTWWANGHPISTPPRKEPSSG